ncbi:MAG: TlpA family protein disulfide reductase [Acidimicrobiia bacterium]
MTVQEQLTAAAHEARIAVAAVPVAPSRHSLLAPLAGVAALLLLIVAGFWAVGRSAPAGSDAAAQGGPAIGLSVLDWSFERWDGTRATLRDHVGEPLVVNFWASWCPSCIAEMSAALQPLHEATVGDLGVLGLNLQDGRGAADRLAARAGVTYDLGLDRPGEFYAELGGITMPFTVFFDEEGAIVRKVQGPLTFEDLESIVADEFGVVAGDR